MEESSALKHLFGKSLLQRMAKAIYDVYPTFDQKKFFNLFAKLEPLEMKSRVQLIRDELKAQLPENYPKALRVLLDSTKSGCITRFDLWPYSEFIQTYGLDHFELSLDALKEITVLFTSEFAVRPFLIRNPRKTLQYLEKCAKSTDVDLRRWASEGSRPRLPWGERLREFIKDPSPTFPILELLKYDSELYVRKSVANHLNDIAKDHPKKVIEILSRWKKSAPDEHKDKITWIIRHSLRTLIKAGNPGALKLIGVSTQTKIKSSAIKIKQKKFKLGDPIQFEFEIESLSAKPQKLVIDYIIHYVKSNQSTSAKIFKLKTLTLPAKETLTIQKIHTLKQVTTRKHYLGKHALEIQINGSIVQSVNWELVA